MVAAVVSGQNLCRVARVAYGLVEIDYSIEFAAAANPSVDLLADSFLLRTVKAVKERRTKDCILERRNCRPDGPNSLLVSARYELAIARYHVSTRDERRWLSRRRKARHRE